MALTAEKRAAAITVASQRLEAAKSMLAELEVGSSADTCRLCGNGHRYPHLPAEPIQAHIQSLDSFLTGLTGRH